MKLQSIGQDINTLASPLIGTTPNTNRRVHLSMPKYIDKAVERFQIAQPNRRQDSPHPHVIPAYGAKTQFAMETDNSDTVPAADKNFIQQVTGTLLYYARAVDPTILVALSAIAS